MNLEERAQRLVDLEDELNLHETFWGAALFPTASIIKEYSILIALCEEILPDVPNKIETLEKHIAKLKRNRRKYVKHREEEVKELMRETLNEHGLDHIKVEAVVLLDDEAER